MQKTKQFVVKVSASDGIFTSAPLTEAHANEFVRRLRQTLAQRGYKTPIEVIPHN